MKKIEINIKPYEHELDCLSAHILRQTDESMRKDILKYGGRIIIQIKSSGKSGKEAKQSTITPDFIDELSQSKHSLNTIGEKISKLKKIDLLQICKYLKIPIRSNAKIIEIRAEIINHFKSSEIWSGISGIQKE